MERVEVGRYSLILVDIKMPGMTGIELQKRFQKKARSLTRRVVFMTGDVAEASTKYFLSSTKSPYLIKPFDVEQLNEVIARTLTGSA